MLGISLPDKSSLLYFGAMFLSISLAVGAGLLKPRCAGGAQDPHLPTEVMAKVPGQMVLMGAVFLILGFVVSVVITMVKEGRGCPLVLLKTVNEAKKDEKPK